MLNGTKPRIRETQRKGARPARRVGRQLDGKLCLFQVDTLGQIYVGRTDMLETFLNQTSVGICRPIFQRFPVPLK